jgi:hypothetical protein
MELKDPLEKLLVIYVNIFLPIFDNNGPYG